MLSAVVGTMATLLSGLYRYHEDIIDASSDLYGFPLPWLVYSQGFGSVVPVKWTFNWILFILDALLYAGIAYAVFWTLARAKRFRT